MADRESRRTDTAGASARAEFARRREARYRRNNAKYGETVGGLASRFNAPAHEMAWSRGAEGEAAVARALAKRCGPDVVVLHDRRVPGRRRANLDHVAVAPSGVWVIDAKRYRGKAVVKSRLIGRSTLQINGRDQTKLVDAARAQADAIRDLLAAAGVTAPVTSALCFVDTELPLLGLPTMQGVVLTGRRGLAKRLNAAGGLSPETVRSLATLLDALLKPASPSA